MSLESCSHSEEETRHACASDRRPALEDAELLLLSLLPLSSDTVAQSLLSLPAAVLVAVLHPDSGASQTVRRRGTRNVRVEWKRYELSADR